MPYNTWNTQAPYGYGNQYVQNYPQYPQSYAQQGQQAPQTAPIQNGGFVSVPNIEIARNWAVAPGNSVTFKDESAPYIYTKTMGYNQLDTPRFERFRLVKEDDVPQTAFNAPKMDANTETMDLSMYALKSDLEGVASVLDTFKNEMADFRIQLDRIASTKPAGKAEKQEDT